jgi:hypothetical protein
LLHEQKTYDQDLKKNAKNETKAHYLSMEKNNSTTRHEQHFEITLNSNPRMVTKW